MYSECGKDQGIRLLPWHTFKLTRLVVEILGESGADERDDSAPLFTLTPISRPLASRFYSKLDQEIDTGGHFSKFEVIRSLVGVTSAQGQVLARQEEALAVERALSEARHKERRLSQSLC